MMAGNVLSRDRRYRQTTSVNSKERTASLDFPPFITVNATTNDFPALEVAQYTKNGVCLVSQNRTTPDSTLGHLAAYQPSC